MAALDDLVGDMAALLGAPCTLEDVDFRLIAFSTQGESESLDAVRRRSILERGSTHAVRQWFHSHGIRDATGPVRTPPDPELGIAARLCVPARHLGRIHGYFWLLESEQETSETLWPEAVRIAEIAASQLSLVENRQARRDGLFRELVEGGAGDSRRAAEELAGAMGVGLQDPVSCVVVDRPGLPQQLTGRPSRPGVLWAREEAAISVAVIRPSVLKAVTGLTDTLTALGIGQKLASLDVPTFVGIGPVVPGLDDMLRAWSGARVALRVSEQTGAGSVVRWEDLGALALLGVARDDDLDQVLLTPRLRQFMTEAPDLLRTAEVFLDEAGSASRAGDRLGVHRQTVYQRLAQVERATGLQLNRGDDRMRLHLALRLWPYLHTTGR